MLYHDESLPKTQVAFVIPDQYWSGSISLLVDIFAGINILIKQEAMYSTALYEIHFLFEPGMQPKGMSECSFPMREMDQNQYDIVIIPAIWSLTPKQLKEYKYLPS